MNELRPVRCRSTAWRGRFREDWDSADRRPPVYSFCFAGILIRVPRFVWTLFA